MPEELIPADIDLLPVGSIMPFPRGQVPDHWIEFSGKKIDENEYPELFRHFRNLHEQAVDLWLGWGGKWEYRGDVGIQTDKLKTPKLNRDQVVQMLWGVVYKDAPDVVLAIKGKWDESTS